MFIPVDFNNTDQISKPQFTKISILLIQQEVKEGKTEKIKSSILPKFHRSYVFQIIRPMHVYWSSKSLAVLDVYKSLTIV